MLISTSQKNEVTCESDIKFDFEIATVPSIPSEEIGKKIVNTPLKTILKVCRHSKAISKSAVNKAGHKNQRVRPVLGRCKNMNKVKRR